MRPALFLRIASVLTFLHAVAHTVGGVFGNAAPGPQQAADLAMKTIHFQVMGLTRTYRDFYWSKQSSSGNSARWPRRAPCRCVP